MLNTSIIGITTNTPSTVVARDTDGSFAANVVTGTRFYADASSYFTVVPTGNGYSQLVFDTGDYIQYDRTTNILFFYSGGNSTASLTPTGALSVTSQLAAPVALVTGSTASTTTGTGALIVTGGVGIGGDVHVGGDVTAATFTGNGAAVTGVKAAQVTVADTASGATGYLTWAAGSGNNAVAISTSRSTVYNPNTGDITNAGKFITTNSTASTTTATGAIIVTGGVGVGGAINAAGTIKSNTSITTGIDTTSGGGSILINGASGYLNLYPSSTTTASVYNSGAGHNFQTGGVSKVLIDNTGIITTYSTSGSTSTTSGSIVAGGGIGAAGNVYAAAFYGAATGLTSINSGNLTGPTLTANVTASSLTSVGTLTSVNTSGVITTSNTTAATGVLTGAIIVSGSGGGLSVQGNIWAGGDVTAYSDARIKANIQHITDALNKVEQLNGYTFDRTDQVMARQTGVIAQEVLKVLPEAVSGSEETTYGVSYGNMVGLLIEAIKELSGEVKTLRAEVQILKGL
jgi:hypothetical protein